MLNFINKRRNKKGFTLVELVVVIAILGILGAIAIPRFTGMRHEATVKAEASTAQSIISAARVKEADEGKEVVAEGDAAVEVNQTLIETNYMVIPSTPPTFKIEKTGGLYIVTWEDTTAGGGYSGQKQTVTEGVAFKATK